MKKIIPIIIIIIVILGVTYKLLKGNNVTSSNCSQFSNKDGYTGCNSLKVGKENKCKFKINNKINQSTQQMEFEYLCQEK